MTGTMMTKKRRNPRRRLSKNLAQRWVKCSIVLRIVTDTMFQKVDEDDEPKKKSVKKPIVKKAAKTKKVSFANRLES